MRQHLRQPIDTALDQAGDLVEAQADRLKEIGEQVAEEQPVVGTVVGGAAGGVLADRYGKRRVAIGSSVAMGLLL